MLMSRGVAGLDARVEVRHRGRWVWVVALAAVVLGSSLAWAPPAMAVQATLLVRVMEGFSATTVQGATVTVRDLGSGAEVDSGVSDADGELEFTLDEGVLYELRGTTVSGWNGTETVYADGGGIRLLRLNPPTVPVTVSGNVPTVGGAVSTVSVRCSPNQESAPVDPSGHFSVTVMGYPLTSCFIELESTAYDGTISMSAEVGVLPDAPGSYAGTIDFTFPDVQTLRFVNPDGTPATTGILDLSTDESRQRPDETFETVQTSLHWDLADGPAQMLVGGGDFWFTLNAGNGYSLEDPSIISSEPGGMLFTIPTVRTLHISGTAPPGDPSDPTSIQVLCGPDANRVEVAEDGRYELELLTIDTAQCTLRLEALVNETQVSISRPVTFINGFGTADFSIPDDLDVTVTDAEGSAVTDAVMYMSSSGELPMPDGVTATVVTDAQFGLDGSGPTTVSVVRAAEQGYQIQFDGGSRYSGTVNTLGETAVDIGLPPFARIEVTGAVHGWAAGHDGSVRMTCGGDSTTANVDVDGNYAAVLDTFVPPTCSLYLDAQADGTSIGEFRLVTPGVVINGVVSKSADFELPPLVTLHAVDSAEEPLMLFGWISSHAYSVVMPDGGLADVSTQVSGLSFTGSPQFARLTRTSGGWSYLTDGEEYQSEGDADWSGSGDMTFVALDPAPGAWVVGAPNASADGDGVTDVVEGLAPNSGDGNYDGIPDAEQADVTSLTASTGGYVTVAVTEPPGAVFGPVAAVAPGTYPAPPAGVTLPNGLVGFEIDGLTPGETTKVRIYSSSAGDANGYAKWHDDQWEVLPSDRVTIDVTGGFVELTLTDGGMGDDDGIADGTIVDPGGLAVIADQEPPVIDCAPAPTSWSAEDVQISCTASDNGSGLADTADESFVLSTSVSDGTETSSATTGSRQVCDMASNCTTAGPVTGLKVDRQGPSIVVTSPVGGASLVQGATTAAAFSCSDGGSGSPTCVGTVAVGEAVPVATLGAQTFVVTATDDVGNTSTSTVSYVVTAPNQPPVVRADMGVVGLELIGSQSNGIVLTGSFTDADGSGPFSASVRWMNGAAFRPATVAGTSLSASYVYSGAGSRLVTVRVCDAAGACGTDTITVRTGVNRRVVPIAQCVVDGGSAVSPRYTGSFGYDNRTGLALWIPTAGRFENAFTSGASYRGQPQVFVTGRQPAAFTTAFSSGTQTWRLNGSNVSLSPWSRRC